MNITCPKCKKQITLSPDKLPPDKEKAMIKCPGCEQILIFKVPKTPHQIIIPPEPEDITDIDNTLPQPKPKSCTVKLIEKESGKVYNLKTGKNIIGRKADISIDNGDRYIGRKHCLIEIINKPNGIEAILTDDGSITDNGEPSKNGTYQNSKLLSEFDIIYLENNDEVRIGHTDFIIKFQ